MRNLLPCVLISLCLPIGCISTDKETPDPGFSPSDTSHAQAVSVRVALAYRGRLQKQIPGQGRICSLFEETIYATGDGQVNWSIAENGRRVHAGEILAQLDTTLLALQREKLQLQLFNAYREFENLLVGYQPLLIGKPEAETAPIYQQLRARCGIPILEIEQQIHARALQAARIQAPVSGVLADVQLRTGTHIKAGQALYRIHDDLHFFLDALVLGSDAQAFFRGQSAQIKLSTSPGQTFRATLHSINPHLDESGMMQVRLDIHTSSPLIPGTFATAEIARSFPASTLVPVQALVLRDQRPVVFTVKNGRAYWNYVQPGNDNGKEVEILAGITAGDTVILSQNLGLAHRAQVAIKE